MTREQALKLLENLRGSKYKNACIFYFSPVSNGVEERHIYADSYAEVSQWADERTREYNGLNFDFGTYINGGLQFANGYIWKD